MKQIVELLAAETNKAGGINGNQVEIVVEDDGGDPRQAALAANPPDHQGNFLRLSAPTDRPSPKPSQNIYAESGILQVATGSTAIRLSEKSLPLFFRTCPRDDEQGMVAAKTLGELGFSKIAILHDNTSYAKGSGRRSQIPA